MADDEMHPVPAELWQAYLSARFEVDVGGGSHVVLTVGQPASGLDSHWQDNIEAFIVTAHNPYSQLLSAAENQRRGNALLEQVRAEPYSFLPTAAVDAANDTAKKWPDESGVLIFGATIPAAIQLAAEFQQYAIVRVPRVGNVECLPVNVGEYGLKH